MKKRNSTEIYKITVTFLFFLLFSSGFSQNMDRNFKSYNLMNDTLSIKVNDGEYKIVYYSPEIVETSFIPISEVINKESSSVVLTPEKVKFAVLENESSLTVDSEGIDINISKNPFQIQYMYNEEEVISERTGYSKLKEYHRIEFNITPEEILFEVGGTASGINRSGNRIELNNGVLEGQEDKSDLMSYTLPVVFSSNKYLINFDNVSDSPLDLDSKKDNTLSFETINGRKTYQVVVGDTWENIVENYTGLTGLQPMPPRWALGNFLSMFEHYTQKGVLGTIQKFKEDSIPLDAVIIDPFLIGKEGIGSIWDLEFNRDSFPEPEKMIEELGNQGVKTILVTKPSLPTTSSRWSEAVKEKVLVTDDKGKLLTFDGTKGLIDVFKPGAKDWLWNIYRDFAEMGVAGWLGDPGESRVQLSELSNVSDTTNERLNTYGNEWAKIIFEGYMKDFSEQRPFIIITTKATDPRKFEYTYLHLDPGRFNAEKPDDELYLRLLQNGVFQPVYTSNSRDEVPSESMFEETSAKVLAKKAIELRYQLLPYNYTLVFQNSTSGLPLMRPLFFEEPDNKEIYEIADTYLWGKDILVSPVMSSGLKEKLVVFPGNSNWFDAYSGKKYSGGTTQNIPVVKEHIPSFVRGGAFIPMAKPFQTTSNYTGENLEVHYYFDEDVKESSGFLYHDDGKTINAFGENKYEIIKFTSNQEPKILNLRIEKEAGGEAIEEIKLIEVIIENLKKPVDVVWVNTLRFTAKNYMHQGKLVIPVRFDNEVTTIKLEFN